MNNNTTFDKNEKSTQKKVISFFRDPHYLNYKYIGNLQDQVNENFIFNSFSEFLHNKKYSSNIVYNAATELSKYRTCVSNDLYNANKIFYTKLKYGVQVEDEMSHKPITVKLIDFDNPTDNIFEIAEEVTVIKNLEKRPDLVLYVNGIALAVIELKQSAVSIEEGIRQNLGNQKPMFIESFFTTSQVLVAGNEIDGLKYGTTKTAEKFYAKWKDDGYDNFLDERDEDDINITEKLKSISIETNNNLLLLELYQLFDKKRFLDIINNFIVFDGGKKKLCRYYQYFAVKRCKNRIKNKKNGIIWHSQGSGKTLTMVFLSNYILSEKSKYPNARVLIVTDRDELDDQIEKKFTKDLSQNIIRTKSIKNLIEELNSFDHNLMCSLIHKFGRKDRDRYTDIEKENEINKSYDEYINNIENELPKDFKVKGDMFVFVDECHRTQSGKLHDAMVKIMPDATFFGFTGTPLLKEDKKHLSSVSRFGTYIHRYSYEEAVTDGVILDLRYTGRNIEQDLSDESKVDEWFDNKTKSLSAKAKEKLKKRWGTLQSVFSSKNRINKIVDDIVMDFEIKERLVDGKGNALLVADSIYNACRYYENFNNIPEFKGKVAIITSFEPNSNAVSKEIVTSDGEETESFLKYRVYMGMLGIDIDNIPKNINIEKTVEKFEEDAKKLFVDEPANMKLLIVVDKLLTGFDAPHCTYLYIDSSLKDHNLFQAICRPNRLDTDDKKYGYIIDYKQLFSNLLSSMEDYAGSAFENLDTEECKNIIKDDKNESIKEFYKSLEVVENICSNVDAPKGDNEYKKYFCLSIYKSEEEENDYERMRQRFYKSVSRLFNTWVDAKGYLCEDKTKNEISELEKTVKFYIKLKDAIGNFSGDSPDLKQFEPDMRKMIDRFIDADNSEELGKFNDFTLLDFIIAKQNEEDDNNDDEETKIRREGIADTITNNIRRKIIEKKTKNPIYYDSMSKILNDILELRKKGVENYKLLLEKYKELVIKVEEPEKNNDVPESLRDNNIKMMFYYNIDENINDNREKLALKLYDAFINNREKDFTTTYAKSQKVKGALNEVLKKYYNNNDDEAENEVKKLYKLLSIQ